MKQKINLVLHVTLVLITALTACAPATQGAGGQDIPFVKLISGDAHVAGFTQPTILILGKIEDTQGILDWLDPEQADVIRGFDFGSNLLVIVFRPEMPTTGYGIEITALRAMPEGIRIEAKLTEPAPDSTQTDVLTFPYFAITIPVKYAPASSTAWKLVDAQGNLLAETIYP